jgi:hypothetical protein
VRGLRVGDLGIDAAMDLPGGISPKNLGGLQWSATYCEAPAPNFDGSRIRPVCP